MSTSIDITVEADNSPYRSEGKVYPREVQGRYQRLRVAAVFWLLGMFYLIPWLQWDGRQAVLFDLPARKFHVFSLVFWPQDFIFLALLLILAGLALFFFTALAGRLWCGYACPQTVWTEVFLWSERWIEGDRRERIKLDEGPWNGNKIRRKLAKHTVWIVFALWTGFTFVGFFTPIRDLGARMVPFQWGAWETFWVFFYALATWGNAGFLREQVCKYMCPYARFQSAMFDRNTLIIAYDPRRGEPRGPRKRSLGSVKARGRGLLPLERAQAFVVGAYQRIRSRHGNEGVRVTTDFFERALDDGSLDLATATPVPADQLGDCIDCTICVQVCPTGIDIRNGLQYECIACAACIDACNDVMDKMGYPRGLIRHTTQNALDGTPSRILRPRVLVYASLLLAILIGWGVGISQREPLIVDVLRDRNALFRVLGDGSVENAYTMKVSNKDNHERQVVVTLDTDAALELVGAPVQRVIAAGATDELALTLRSTDPEATPSGRIPVVFVVTRPSQDDQAEVVIHHSAPFFAPL
ncbi:MAG: 4Fe-4S binding protein [Xanthomonadales bacterium]|nr:4Fe-4S binding protein [Xanthomonadales bacterium]